MARRNGFLACVSLSVLGLVACGEVPTDEIVDRLPDDVSGDEGGDDAPEVTQPVKQTEAVKPGTINVADAGSTTPAHTDSGSSTTVDNAASEIEAGAAAATATCTVPQEARLEDVSKPTTV